jgi:hypothetical protein
MVFYGINLARSGEKDVVLPLLPDLSRDKSGRACLPLAGALPRQPSQARPDLQLFRHAEHPLASGLRLQPTDRVTVHWTVT